MLALTVLLPYIAKSDTTEMNISNSSKPKKYNNLLFSSAVPPFIPKSIHENEERIGELFYSNYRWFVCIQWLAIMFPLFLDLVSTHCVNIDGYFYLCKSEDANWLSWPNSVNLSQYTNLLNLYKRHVALKLIITKINQIKNQTLLTVIIYEISFLIYRANHNHIWRICCFNLVKTLVTNMRLRVKLKQFPQIRTMVVI